MAAAIMAAAIPTNSSMTNRLVTVLIRTICRISFGVLLLRWASCSASSSCTKKTLPMESPQRTQPTWLYTHTHTHQYICRVLLACHTVPRPCFYSGRGWNPFLNVIASDVLPKAGYMAVKRFWFWPYHLVR